jgi:hypothetical protein
MNCPYLDIKAVPYLQQDGEGGKQDLTTRFLYVFKDTGHIQK